MTASTILLVILSVAVIAALLYPLIVSAARDRRVSRGPSELDALLRRKAVLYTNMKDLEFEHQMGKLSEADYDRLRSEDRAEAARLLQEIDALEDVGDADAIIEREIAARVGGEGAAEVEGVGVSSAAGRSPRAPQLGSLNGRAAALNTRAADDRGSTRLARPMPSADETPAPSTSAAPSMERVTEERTATGGSGTAQDEGSRSDAATVFCASCGARSRVGDRFCWRCGAALYAGENE